MFGHQFVDADAVLSFAAFLPLLKRDVSIKIVNGPPRKRINYPASPDNGAKWTINGFEPVQGRILKGCPIFAALLQVVLMLCYLFEQIVVLVDFGQVDLGRQPGAVGK